MLNPLLAYAVSVLGCVLGLRCTARGQWSAGRARALWLLAGAAAIGGTGIWVMHFIAMLGFSVTGTQVRYDIPRTLLSLLVAIVIVAIGLFIVGFRGTGTVPLLQGGTVTGLGVAAMHYMGMAAIGLNGHIHYAAGTVVLSVVIAVGASTAALWAAMRVHRAWATVGAAMVMGVAVCSMHYTGMAAVHVTTGGHGTVPGTAATAFLVPMMTAILLLTFVLLGAVLLDPPRELVSPRTPATPDEREKTSLFERR
ncbi:MHYT domain-containing protein [Streptomyces sp.]|uniref:MHYT domain-containing protein n=1 Tax=Streptomyces sp. TaxID=1931 RepID=UPI002F42CE98